MENIWLALQRDSTTFIAVVALLISVATPIIGYIKGRKIVKLTYTILWTLPLINFFPLSFFVHFRPWAYSKNNFFQDARITRIKIKNVGTVAIAKDVYNVPIQFIFDKSSIWNFRVFLKESPSPWNSLGFEETSSIVLDPDEFITYFHVLNNRLEMQNVLFNKGQITYVDIISTGKEVNIRHKGQLINGSITKRDVPGTVQAILGLLFLIVLVSVLVIIFDPTISSFLSVIVIVILVMAFFACLINLIIILIF